MVVMIITIIVTIITSIVLTVSLITIMMIIIILRATLDVPKPKSGGLVKKVGPFSKRKNPL